MRKNVNSILVDITTQTPNSVVPELRAFVSLPGISSNEHTPELSKEAYTTLCSFNRIMLIETKGLCC